MKILKRALSLFIVGLFVFTAFAVIQSGGTNTASIHSVSSSTSILPYTTTSNGLIYTVEPNGTYLWNGHYLRDPPVPYPKVPTIAPDGLPYGAVGKIGAQGQVGAKSFPKGTAQIIGVSPATTAGTDTLISANTFWGNETITLVGNVSIENGISLTIYNSNITFSEPASTTSYAYGFNVSYNGHGDLYFRHGTVITQSNPSTTNSWFIWGTGAITGYGIVYTYSPNTGPLPENFTVISTNTTLFVGSNHTVGNTPRNTPGGYWSPPAMTGFQLSYFNYSTYNGEGYFNFKNSLNVTYSSHNSLFLDGAVSVHNPYNSTFSNVSISFRGNLATAYGTFTLNYDSIIDTSYMAVWFMNDNPGVGAYVSNTPVNVGAGYIGVNNTLFDNINMSGFGASSSAFYGWFLPSLQMDSNPGPGVRLVVKNTTIENVSTVGGSMTIIGALANNGLASSYSQLWNAVVCHNTIMNVRSGSTNGKGFTNGFTGIGYGPLTSERYNLFKNISTINRATEPEAVYISGWSYNFSWNIIDGFYNAPEFPLYENNAFTYRDSGGQVYAMATGWGPGKFVSGDSNSITPSPPYSSMVRVVSHNYLINITGQSFGIQITGWWVNVNNNTVINLNSSTGIAFSVGSSSVYSKAVDNTAYGVYNYSTAIGSNGGGAYQTTYISNTANDVDTVSYGMITANSNETYYKQTGSLLLGNSNTSSTVYFPSDGAPYLSGKTTDVWIDNSSLSQISIGSSSGTGLLNFNEQPFPDDFNITLYNTYVPGEWGIINPTNGSQYPLFDPFSFSNGPYTLSAPYSNSYFLNLTGYLGIYPSQTYTLNASNIKGESSLPVYLAGSQIASIPASSAHYNLTASYSSGTLEYSLSANSASDQPISLMWNGQVPNTEYSVAMYDHGKLIDYTNVTSSANGVVTFTYNPATMPLDPVFELTTFHIVTSGSTAVPPEVFLYVLLAGGALLGAGAIIVAAVDRRRYR